MLSVNSPIESWILDSGASFHSTSCKESLQNYVAGNFGKVYLADDEPLNIEGKGRTSQCGQDRNRSKSKRRSKSKPSGDGCWNCGKKGHLRSDCRLPKKKNKG